MTPEQHKLYNSIDEILWFDWDPIGVNKDGKRDEYYGYVPQVFQLKISSADKMIIAKHLDNVAMRNMGMESNMEFSEQIAEKIIALE